MKQLSPASRARYFRRQLVDRLMGGLCIFAAGVGLVLLALILWMLFSNGLAGLSLDVFTKPMSQPGSGGGLANAIIGSVLQVGVGAMIGAPLGMMVSYGNASGPPPAISPLELSKRGSLFLTRPSLFAYIAKREDLDASARELFRVVAQKKVKLHIGQRYALSDAADAHRDLEARRTVGSTVLIP